MKKIGYLFLALALPGLIFVFLRKFGKNEFNLPVYHSEGRLATPCGEIEGPYRLPDSVMSDSNVPTTLFVLPQAVTRIEKGLGDGFTSNDYQMVQVDTAQRTLEDCVLILNGPWTAVLVDGEGQIRGYYEPSTREEMDRLKMEMSILLKRY